MTEKEVKTLLRLLAKFRDAEELELAEGKTLVDKDLRVVSMINLIMTWVRWYGIEQRQIYDFKDL